MAFTKITDDDLKNKGNVGQPDTPNVSTSEMQRIMDEIPREVIVPAFNALIDELGNNEAANTMGATAPDGLSGNTVQEVLDSLSEALDDHKEDTDNPHKVTAAQVNAYTKEETDAAIDEKVTAIGSADMTKSVYDTLGKEQDIFLSLPMRFAATLLTDGWTQEDDVYTQTAALTSLDDAVIPNESSIVLSGPMCIPTGVQATDELLAEALTILNAGTATTSAGAITCNVWEKPSTDIEAIWIIRNM